jgi:hypothetical protein
MLRHSSSDLILPIGVSNSNPDLIQSESSKRKQTSLNNNLGSQNFCEGSKEADGVFDIFVDDQAVPETDFDRFE